MKLRFSKVLLASLLMLPVLFMSIGTAPNTQLQIEDKVGTMRGQPVFSSNESIPSVTHPNVSCAGKFMYRDGCIPHTQYRLSIRYNLSSLVLRAEELGYYADVSVMDAGRTWVPFYNELHGTNVSGTVGYVEHHVGYDLVATEPDWVTTYIAVLTVTHKVADGEKYIMKLYNTSDIITDGYQYINLNQRGRCDLSDQHIKGIFREMLGNMGIPSEWLSQVRFAENTIFYSLPDKNTRAREGGDAIVYFESQGAIRTYLNITELTELAETIVIGNVTEILPSWQDTETGTIYTDVIVDIETCMKISLNQSTILVRTLGGTVGNLSMGMEDEVGFTEGEIILLFLGRTELYGNALHVIGGHQGKYTLQNGMAINKDPSRNTTLEVLLEEIEEAV